MSNELMVLPMLSEWHLSGDSVRLAPGVVMAVA